jgi:hypothetical protein
LTGRGAGPRITPVAQARRAPCSPCFPRGRSSRSCCGWPWRPDKGWGAAWNKSPEAPPAPAQLAVAWGELIGGIALAFGFLTRLAAAGIAVIMAGAIATVHWPHGFDLRQGGFEYNFVLIVACLCLILGGPGPFAVDRVFRLRRDRAR